MGRCSNCGKEGHNARTCKGKKRKRAAPAKGKGKGKGKAKAKPAKKKAKQSTGAKYYVKGKHYDFHNFDPSWGEEAVTETMEEDAAYNTGPHKTKEAANNEARSFFSDWDQEDDFEKYRETFSSDGLIRIKAVFWEGEVRRAKAYCK